MAISTVEQYDTPIDLDGEVTALAERVSADGPRLPLAASVLDEAAAKRAARKAVAELVDKQALDAMLAQVKGDGLRLTGPGGREVTLSEVEAGVLLHLAGTPGVIWPAEAILESLDGARPSDADRAVPAIIAKLRKKLGALGGPAAQRLIKTEIGRGYVFAAEAARTEPAAFSGRDG